MLIRGTIRIVTPLGTQEIRMARLRGNTPEERQEEIRRRWEAKEAEREGLSVDDPGIREKGQRFIGNYVRKISR